MVSRRLLLWLIPLLLTACQSTAGIEPTQRATQPKPTTVVEEVYPVTTPEPQLLTEDTYPAQSIESAAPTSVPYPAPEQPATTLEQAAYPPPAQPTAASFDPPYPYPPPGQSNADVDIVNWDQAVNFILNGEITSVSQFRDLTVVLTFADGRMVKSTEPEFDAVFQVIEQCGEPCENIEWITE